MYNILLVEDSLDSYNLIRNSIDSSIKLTWAQSYDAALEMVQSNPNFDLYLLDVLLPDGNGFQLAKEIYRINGHEHTSVIFITSQSSTSDIVAGFSLGAQDYITKPFNILELGARIEAKLRQGRKHKDSQLTKTFGPLTVDFAAHTAVVGENGKIQKLDLTLIEFKILSCFMSNCNTVVTRDDILNFVWGNETHVYPRSVDAHVSKIRSKLGIHSDLIESVRGVGYRLMPPKT